jgi:trehalose 6-phosphate synthase/phosphatase
LWFADTGVGLSAEHGCFYRHPRKLGYTFGNWGTDEQDESIAMTPSNDGNIKRVSKGWFALVDNVDLSYREVWAIFIG